MFISIKSGNTIFIKLLLLLTTLFITVPYAEDQEDTSENPDSTSSDAFSLDKMVITATRNEQRLSEIPANVTLINREKISTSSARNIGDMLSHQTGISMKRVAGMGEGIPADIIMRAVPPGFSATRTLILIDGIPANPSGSPFLILNQVPLESIKTIEIVRGPYSSMYGANAFSGVINIITEDGDSAPFVRGNIKTGNMAFWDFSGTSGGLFLDRFRVMINGGYRTIDNYFARDSSLIRNINQGNSFVEAKNHDYQDSRLFCKTGIQPLENLDISIQGRYFKSDLGFGRTKNVVPDPYDITTKGELSLIGPEINFSPRNSIDLTLKGYYRRLRGHYSNEDVFISPSDTFYVPSKWSSREDDWQISLNSSFFSETGRISNTFSAGIEYLENRIDFGAMRNRETGAKLQGRVGKKKEISNAALYLQDQLEIAERIEVIPSGRIDYNSDFGIELSPKLGIRGSLLENLNIKTSIGKAFRAPTLVETSLPKLIVNPDFSIVPNPDLKPEYIYSADLSFEYLPAERLRLKTGCFFNKMEDLILPGAVYDNSTGDIDVTHRNSSKALSWGIETEAEISPFDFMNIRAGYVYQPSIDSGITTLRRDRFEVEDPSVQLDYIPKHKVDLSVFINKDIGDIKLGFGWQNSYGASRECLAWDGIEVAPEYTQFEIIDGEFKAHLNPPVSKLEDYVESDISGNIGYRDYINFKVGVENLFDYEYQESGGTLSPGRMFFFVLSGGIKMKQNQDDSS